MQRFNTASQGFTLIELLIVMAILAMLATIVGQQFWKQHDQAKVQATKHQLSVFASALDTYRLDVGKYPRSLEALVKNDGSSQTWNGPYLKKSSPKDPWGGDYHYQSPGRHNKDYDLYSLGADNQEGGEGVDADITNWQQ